MKVLHVIPWISRRQGGPSRSSQGLVAALCAAGVDAWLQPLEPSEDPWIPGVRYFSQPITEETVQQFDLVHIHEVWNPKLHQVAALCRKAGVPYVIAPRGMLEPWSLKQKWLKKRIARFLYQDRDLKLAAALHATAESEAEQFRRLGFKNRIILSPNGVNVPERELERRGGQRRALFVSRMHPKKGVLELVESWARVKEGSRGSSCSRGSKGLDGWTCELVYTMNSEEERAYEQKVKDRILALGMSTDFILTGPLDDEKKWEAYARADLFVLPTYSENFGIVVAEALWAGLPVITTKGTPWKELEGENEGEGRGRCGWWINLPEARGKGEGERWKALDAVLRGAFGRDDLREMGARGRALVEAKYTWPAVAKKMREEYGKLKG